MTLLSSRGAKPGFRLAAFATFFTISVVVLGAFTRLVDAGLGCPDWPLCYGHIWAPQTEAQIAAANEAWPEIPVDLDKTWPEMVHRYLATGLGFLVLLLAGVSWKHRKKPGQPVKLAFFILALVILQGAFGAWTVTMKLWPQVVTAHLLGGFATFTLLWLLTIKLSGERSTTMFSLNKTSLPTGLAMATLFVVIAQITLGGWTTSNYAALACPDFPKCQTQWWPEMDFADGFDVLQPVGPNYLGGQLDVPGRTAIHMAHRLGAIVTLIFCLWLALRLYLERFSGMATTLVTVTLVQVALGISNIIFSLPLTVAVLHNLGGAILLAVVATITYQLHRESHNA
ncbi:MAG: COX15/CtaA family protein [Saccharospirillum sp.]|nr:COX15/CtaA family protein [Saccharospirillum sp.]